MEQTGKKWYVVLSKPRQEETAKFHLSAKGIEVFYPRLLLPVPNKSGKQVVALFPNYLFVRIYVASSEYFQVSWCRGVKRLVSFGGTPASVEDGVVEFLRDQAEPGGLIAATSTLKAGDQIQITKGPFKGLVGIIQEPPDNKSRVKVLLAILSRQVQVEVSASYVDVDWVAPCATA